MQPAADHSVGLPDNGETEYSVLADSYSRPFRVEMQYNAFYAEGWHASAVRESSTKPMTTRLKQSAGLLMFRRREEIFEVFLVHPGGPYWSRKEEGAWTMPKGQCESGVEPLAAAEREFHEETSFIASGPFIALGSVRQKGGKEVFAWAFEGNCYPGDLVSNTCEVEWPPRSGNRIVIPEVDRGDWFTLQDAAISIREEQRPLLLRIEEQLSHRRD